MRQTREFIVFESGNKMKVDVAHIYALQEFVQEQGDVVTPGTNVYFDFGIIIFVKEEYSKLTKEIFGDEDESAGLFFTKVPGDAGNPPNTAN